MADDDDTSEEKKGLTIVHKFCIVGASVATFAGVAVSSWEKVEVFVEKKWGSKSAEVVKIKDNLSTDNSAPLASNSNGIDQEKIKTIVVVENPENDGASANIRVKNDSVVKISLIANNSPTKKTYKLNPPEFINTKRLEYLNADGRGSGAKRENAIRAALREAVSKGLGGIASAEVDMQITTETNSLDDQISQKREEKLGQKFNLKTGGLIAWWGVTTEEKISGSWDVSVQTILVKVRPRSMDPDSKWVISVAPFYVENDFKIFAGKIDKKTAANIATSSLSRQIVQTRKFGVEDKNFDAEVSKLNISQGQGFLDDVIRLAENSTVDFIVSGEAQEVQITRFKQGVGALKAPAAEGSVNYLVTDTLTGKTVFSRTINLEDFNSLDLSSSRAINLLFEEVAKRMTNEILEAIYPLLVASLVGDNEVALNRGGETLKIGSIYGVYSSGEKIIDPSTKEILGDNERRIGTIEISRVTPKVSYARIIDQKEKFLPSNICRAESK